jgi:hypothetical protein
VLNTRAKLGQVRAQAGIPAGTEILLIANDGESPRAETPTGSSPYVHATWISPAIVAHEMGHFFEWRGSAKWGHADVAREFFRDEYADRTCVMGGENAKLTFSDPAVPPLPRLPMSRRSGPGMNPALVDQCGWLDTTSRLVRTIDPSTLGSALLQPWRGAPRADSIDGAPVVAIVDGLDPDGGRIYVCVREESGWDRGFSGLSTAAPFRAGPQLRVFAYVSTPSGDSLCSSGRTRSRAAA